MTSAHSILPLLSTILLLYSAATPTVSGAPIPVRDTDGDPVLTGAHYYITGALESNENGLHLIRHNNQCRHNVKLEPPKFGPWVVFARDVDEPSINETININENVVITSGIPVVTLCNAIWWLNAKSALVTVGAHYLKQHNTTFRILRHGIVRGYYYKIQACSKDGTLCLTLGVNEQLLGLNTTPLIVQFQKEAKVSQVSAAMHSTA